MDFLTGSNDLGTLGLGLLIAGAAVGLFGGILGRGAGLILVSALFLVARSAGIGTDLALRLAVGTSFACLVPLSLGLLATHGRSVDWAAARRASAPLALGIAAGTWFGLTIPQPSLAVVFAATAIGAAGLAVWVSVPHDRAPSPIAGAVIAFLQGGLASALGIGGGSFAAPVMMLNGTAHDKAKATASLFAVPIAAAGALVAVASGWNVHGLPKYSYGYVNLLAFGVIAPVAFATSLIGAHFAPEIDTKRLQPLFALLVVASAARMMWDVAG